MAIQLTNITDATGRTDFRPPTPPIPTAQSQNFNSHATTEFEPQEIQRSVAALEEAMRHFNRRIRLNYNADINRVIVKVIDRNSDRIIREIPTAEIQRLITRMRETIGVIFDEER